MKGLLVFPPQWYPGNPYPAVPLLLGQLKRAGFDAKGVDLNINFYNKILTKSFLELSVRRAKELMVSLPFDLAKYSGKAKDHLPTDIQVKMKKLLIIKDYVLNHADKLETVPQEIETSVNTLKNPELFYNPELLFKAKEVIFNACKIVSLPFAPAELSFANYNNPIALSCYDELKAQCYDDSTNMFIEYFENKIEDIIGEDADYVVISLADMTQLIPAFTLGRLLKERYGMLVCFGGNIVTKLLESFKQHHDILDTFCDFLSYGDGENSIISFAEYISGTIPIERVPGLIYLNSSGEICDNGPAVQTNLDDVAGFSFDGFEFDEYFSPEPVLTIQLSKGCYWGKCAFCDVSYCRKDFKMKSPSRAIEEFKTLKKRYNIRSFVFSDDSVSPQYYMELSELLIANNLDVNIFSWIRLEEGFTKDVLSKMKQAGCKMAFWGYESESERVMSLINKGINNKRRLEILENSKEAGIWNHVAFMVGFPTETESEAIETTKIINKHMDIIDSCYLSKFSFKKNATISNHPEKYGVESYVTAGEFQLDFEYTSAGMTKVEKKDFYDKFRSDYFHKNIDRLWPMLVVEFEQLLLYLSHYDRDWVKNYRLKTLPKSVNGFIAKL